MDEDLAECSRKDADNQNDLSADKRCLGIPKKERVSKQKQVNQDRRKREEVLPAMSDNLLNTNELIPMVAEIKQVMLDARTRVVRQINGELLVAYWNIGRIIV